MNAVRDAPTTDAEKSATPEWVFGYGSLMWRPGFAWREKRTALLRGWHRAFCRYSFRHRGTREQPGLVIGLEEGGTCAGLAFQLEPASREEALVYLDEREGAGYRRLALPLELGAGAAAERIRGWVYIPDPSHGSYFGSADPLHIARLIATGRGESGTAYDYLVLMLAELDGLGVDEPDLRAMLARVEDVRRGEARDAAPPAGLGAGSSRAR